jgi:hypothetical protein
LDINRFKQILAYNEPSFGYNGKEYSICSPDGKYYVTAEDSPGDIDLVFKDPDDLLDHWLVQGKPLRDILQNIDLS